MILRRGETYTIYILFFYLWEIINWYGAGQINKLTVIFFSFISRVISINRDYFSFDSPDSPNLKSGFLFVVRY